MFPAGPPHTHTHTHTHTHIHTPAGESSPEGGVTSCAPGTGRGVQVFPASKLLCSRAKTEPGDQQLQVIDIQPETLHTRGWRTAGRRGGLRVRTLLVAKGLRRNRTVGGHGETPESKGWQPQNNEIAPVITV
uniref:Uncharacterized protein n=1 Tax=Pipistrellus kuhlii TaxID=59472 RepID=A0A7J7YMR1_PIPKU|nr:hypothetical protein mPipKuh1_010096 [Pipistrellus kuhlii]